MQYGRIPLQTVSSNVYYSFNNVMTVHGLYGLKIWYYI
jgi:ribosomal protein S3